MLEQVGAVGYVVDHEHRDGHAIRATSPSGATWTVRAADLHTAACELVEQVGLHLAET
jgi:hypothetical protein